MRLRTKIAAHLLFTVLVVAGVAQLFRLMGEQVTRNLDSITGNLFPSISRLEAINTAAIGLWESSGNTWYISRLANPHDRTAIEREKLEFRLAEEALSESVHAYKELVTKSPEEYPHAPELLSLLTKLVEQSRQLLLMADNNPGLRDGDHLADEIESTLNRMTLVTGLARQLELANLKERETSARNAIASITHFSKLSTLCSILITVILSALVIFQLLSPILELRAAAEAVGTGNLDVQVQSRTTDELGELIEAFNAMVINLRDTTISKSFVEGVFFSMHEALFIVNADGQISHVNRAGREMLTIDETQIVGSNFSDYFFAVAEPRPFDSLSQKSEYRMTLALPSGVETPVSVTRATSESTLGSDVYVVRDISELLRHATETRRIREQLSHSQQLSSLGALSAILAHRLNQPLTVIQLKLQQILRTSISLECSEKLVDCLSEARATADIVKDVLRYTRPTRIAELSPISFYAIASRIAGTFIESLRDCRLEVNIEGLKSLPNIPAAQEEWEEIFYVLMENAIHAAPGNRSATLTISGSLAGTTYEIQFLDTCSGISPANLPHVFELFFSTKPRSKGTGLGLSIVKQLVTARGGNVSVSSELGTGTSFTFSMPFRTAETEIGVHSV